jgi:hypothetical protein
MRFAKIDNNIVTELILCDPNSNEQEAEQFCIKEYGNQSIYKRYKRSFVQDSINSDCYVTIEGRIWIKKELKSRIRANTPNIGDIYDSVNDVFYKKQPFSSWILNSNFQWEAPVPKPNYDIVNQRLEWSEENQNWTIYNL